VVALGVEFAFVFVFGVGGAFAFAFAFEVAFGVAVAVAVVFAEQFDARGQVSLRQGMAQKPRPAPRDRSPTQMTRIGLQSRRFADLYHQLLLVSWTRLMLLVVSAYLVANTIFALLYLATGGGIENAREGSFLDLFFFSVQTMATIGYGKLVPISVAANILVTFESLLGLMGFALMTGLIFAKFARPTAAVLFSDNLVVTGFEGTPSLMLRVANARTSQIVEAQLRVVLMRGVKTAEGHSIRRLVDLHLLRSNNAFFALSWTAIHPIDERSPLFGMTSEEVDGSDISLVVSLVGIEEVSGQTVHARRWYGVKDIRWNMRFADIMSPAGPGSEAGAIIDYSKFNDLVPAEKALPSPLGAPVVGLAATS